MNKHIKLQGILLDAGQRFLQGSILLGSPDERAQWGYDQTEWRFQLMRHIDEELIFCRSNSIERSFRAFP